MVQKKETYLGLLSPISGDFFRLPYPIAEL